MVLILLLCTFLFVLFILASLNPIELVNNWDMVVKFYHVHM